MAGRDASRHKTITVCLSMCVCVCMCVSLFPPLYVYTTHMYVHSQTLSLGNRKAAVALSEMCSAKGLPAAAAVFLHASLGGAVRVQQAALAESKHLGMLRREQVGQAAEQSQGQVRLCSLPPHPSSKVWSGVLLTSAAGRWWSFQL
jgi:hypothetical protein